MVVGPCKSALELINAGSSQLQHLMVLQQNQCWAIAHFNMAVEQESLGLRVQASSSYLASIAVAKEDLGVGHPLTKNISKNAQAGLKWQVPTSKRCQVKQIFSKKAGVTRSGRDCSSETRPQ